MPKRIRLSRRAGFKLPDNAKSVARPTRWGNPFPVVDEWTAADVVRMFRDVVLDGEATFVHDSGTKWENPQRYTGVHLVRRGSRLVHEEPPTVEQIRAELAGKDLACWCPLDQPCHADVLLELANEGA